MKSLSDIQEDMSKLYDEVRAGKMELKTASELANIAGKYLKAEQLKLARDIFLKGLAGGHPLFPGNKEEKEVKGKVLEAQKGRKKAKGAAVQ